MTTSLKVKLRPSAVAGRAGTVCYQVCRKGLALQISTRLKLQPGQWDALSECIVQPAGADAPALQAVQRQIDCDMDLLRQILRSFELCGADFSARDVVAHFRAPDRRITVLECLRERIEALTTEGRLGTARNYRRALSSFGSFLAGRDLPLCTFGERIVLAYAAWLRERGVVRNSLSFYMRILRSVYNRAVGEKAAMQTDPFRNVYTGVDRTRKRAVKEETLVALRHLDLPAESPLAFARDLFIFSYCMRGMAFVDLAFLGKDSVRHDAICYVRRKTGQRLAVGLEPCMRELIDRYAPSAAGTPYLFPILSSPDPYEAYRQYQTALGSYNMRLRKLSAMLGSGVRLSSYTSRHTWATTARDHNIPLPVISAGMGHTSEETTRIYLASLENSVIDTANRSIIALLNG